MRVKLILLLVILLFLASCTYRQNADEQQGKPAIYIVEEPKAKTFVVGEKDTSAWAEQTKFKRNELNAVRALKGDKKEQEEFEVKSKLKNVRRIVDGEVIIGFDNELDNPKFKKAYS